MKEKTKFILLILFCIFTLLSQHSTAQFAIPHNVIGNGFTTSSNNNFSIKGTIGQSLSGLSSNSDYLSSIGFWYNLYHILTNIEDPPKSIPLKYFLDQNYPNPFNPITHIRYAVPKVSHITLEIFNVLGQRVVLLVDKQAEPGIHIADFDAGNLASGFYIYRMQSKGFSSTKRMLLIK